MTVKKALKTLDYEATFADISVSAATNIDIMDAILTTLEQFNKSYQQLQIDLTRQSTTAPKTVTRPVAKSRIFKKVRNSYMDSAPGTKLNEIIIQLYSAITDPAYLSMFTKGNQDFFISKMNDIKAQYEKNVNQIKTMYGKSLEALKQHQKTYTEALDLFYENCQKLEEVYDAMKNNRNDLTIETYENMLQTVDNLHKSLDNALEDYNSERWQFNEEADTSLVIWEEAELARHKTVTNLIGDFARVFLQISCEAREFSASLKEMVGKYDQDLDVPHLDTGLAQSLDKNMTFVEYEAPPIPVDISEFIPTSEFFSDELGAYDDVLVRDYEGDINISAGEVVTVHYKENKTYIVTVKRTGQCTELPFEYLANQPTNRRTVWKVNKKCKIDDTKVEENTVVAVSEIIGDNAICVTMNNKKLEIPLKYLTTVK